PLTCATSACSPRAVSSGRYLRTLRMKKRSPAGKRRFTPLARCVAATLPASQVLGTSRNATFGARGSGTFAGRVGSARRLGAPARLASADSLMDKLLPPFRRSSAKVWAAIEYESIDAG